MFFLRFHARPDPDKEIAEEAAGAAGAYVCCWIDFAEAEGAEILARHYIGQAGWISDALEEVRKPERDDYATGSNEQAYFDEASTSGSSFSFILYANDDED